MPDRDKSDMNFEAKPDPEFELLLRSALATYAEPASDSDLVHGILVRVAAEGVPAPARRWLPWAIAIPVAAGLLALVFLFGTRHMHIPAQDGNQAHISQRPFDTTARTGSPATPNSPATRDLSRTPRANAGVMRPRPRPALITAKSEPMPKLDVFPTPQPLTPAERALVAFAVRAPESERQSFIGAQEHFQEPVKISAIEIQPIDSPDKGGN